MSTLLKCCCCLIGIGFAGESWAQCSSGMRGSPSNSLASLNSGSSGSVLRRMPSSYDFRSLRDAQGYPLPFHANSGLTTLP